MLMRTPADPECFSDGNIAFLLYIPLSLSSLSSEILFQFDDVVIRFGIWGI
jgi:hypothetical protein